MKKLFLILVLVYLCIQISYSQIFISTQSKTLELYDDKTRKFTTLSEDLNEMTFFEINRDVTLLKHTTDKMTSLYNIKNWRKNDERESWEFEMISDVGNEYTGSISIKEQVMLFCFIKDNKTHLLSFKIKKTFTKE